MERLKNKQIHGDGKATLQSELSTRIAEINNKSSADGPRLAKQRNRYSRPPSQRRIRAEQRPSETTGSRVVITERTGVSTRVDNFWHR